MDFSYLRHRFRHASLGARVIAGLTILTISIAAVYSVTLWWSFTWVKNYVAADLMNSQLTAKIQALENGVAPQTNPGVTLYGTRPDVKPIPQAWEMFSPGLHEIELERPYFLYIADRGANTYALLKQQGCFKRAETAYFHLIGTVALLVAFGAFGGGWLLYRSIMSPIRRLADNVIHASSADQYLPISTPHNQDEVTVLAQSCDIALERLYTALEREKRFTGDVTHELKTPIQTLTGSLELLTRSPLTDRQRAQAERAQRALKDMQVLVDTFLQISREAELIGPVTPDTLTRMIRHLEEIWRPQAEAKGLQLQVIQEAVCTGFYSPILLGVVLNNLLRNAVTYTASGTVQIFETAHGFVVEDEAGGISPERIVAIFSAPRRLVDADNNGIGLSLVRRICARCGWALNHENTLHGSRFSVVLTA